jgi:hypothetical protein
VEKSKIINALTYLGKHIQQTPEQVRQQAQQSNSWFTPAAQQTAMDNWSDALAENNIHQWLDAEPYTFINKKVGIIMAGNIPLVGLHDLLCVIAKGHIAIVKLSSQDEILMKHAIQLLKQAVPELEDRIIISEKLNGIDYLIATGSNNSARYFEYYFRNIPSLIRKNRTSVAVLTGNETDKELELLSDDIFTFFGLGCRNVTHLLLPEGIELRRLYEAYDKYMDHVNHHKYYNNYMYHKSILLMNLSKHYDNGFMLFQEKEEPHAPIATLNYHFYKDMADALAYIKKHDTLWQCIVSVSPEVKGAIAPGMSQKPMLWDYADNANTLEFLS